MKHLSILLTLSLLLGGASCSGRQAAPAAADAQPAAGKADTTQKTLVVFFSHAGDNYGVGNVEVGNTKILAGYIAETTGADQFEVTTHRYDGMAYKPLCDLAKEEQKAGELPDFEGAIDNIADYQTIFVGSPVWWGTWPQVMFSFFSRYDLNGKTLIPFTTHEGSGFGSCVRDLKKAYPQADVKPGFQMYGHDVRDGKDRVVKWLSGIDY